jgi:hypothetical protein
VVVANRVLELVLVLVLAPVREPALVDGRQVVVLRYKSSHFDLFTFLEFQSD